jgi:hypothetical protein
VAFESVHVSRPESAELSQPGIQLLKRFRFQAVQTALCVHCGPHEPGVAKHPQMLGDSWLRHMKLTFDLAYGLL